MFDPFGKLSSVRKATLPPADNISLRLHSGPDNKPIPMTFKEALQHVKPCTWLAPTLEAIEGQPSTYKIEKLPDPSVTKRSRKSGLLSYKRKGRSRESYFTHNCTIDSIRHKLKLAYYFLMEGSRVEFHLRPSSRIKFPETRRPDSVAWALTNRLYLRPESMLAAMPAGTTMLALPAYEDFSQSRDSVNKIRKQEVFWAMENVAALKNVGTFTTKAIKRKGKWPKPDPNALLELPNDDDPEIQPDAKMSIPPGDRKIHWKPFNSKSKERPSK